MEWSFKWMEPAQVSASKWTLSLEYLITFHVDSYQAWP